MVTGEYTEIQWQVRQLTNSDPWATSPAALQSFIDQLGDQVSESWNEAIDTLRKRLTDEGSNWRNRYKALTFLDHILKHASEEVVQELILADGLDWAGCLEELAVNFTFIDEKGKDEGVNVRVRAGAILELLREPVMLQDVRRQEKERRERLARRRQEFQAVNQSLKEPLSTAADHVGDDFCDFQGAAVAVEDDIIVQKPVQSITEQEQKQEDPFDDLLKL